jgi:hypothetical protein
MVVRDRGAERVLRHCLLHDLSVESEDDNVPARGPASNPFATEDNPRRTSRADYQRLVYFETPSNVALRPLRGGSPIFVRAVNQSSVKYGEELNMYPPVYGIDRNLDTHTFTDPSKMQQVWSLHDTAKAR